LNNHRKRNGFLRNAATAVLLGATWLGAAQAITVLADEEAAKPLQCLTRSAPAPVFPERELKLQQSTTLRVKLSFDRADRAPSVEILSLHGGDEFVDEVQRYLRGYRLPCLVAGQKVEAVQEFVFAAKGGDAVHWTDMRHVAKPPEGNLLSCLRTPSKLPRWSEDDTIGSRIKRPETGNIVLRVRFVKPDAAPEVTIIYNSSTSRMAAAALDHVSEYRLPCLPENGPAVGFEQQFGFTAGTVGNRYVLKDTDLRKFLGAVKDIDKQKVSFDLNTMACPFKVMWAVGQPAFKNRVGEVGERNLNRLEFLAWLEGLTLNVGREVFDQVLGQRIAIDVPCGTINLNG
jgi:hypothetical protein